MILYLASEKPSPSHTSLIHHLRQDFGHSTPTLLLPDPFHYYRGYLPLSEYTDYLLELESVIATLQAEGPVIIAGDFNAHLGDLGYGRHSDPSNQAGNLLSDMVCRCDLFVPSRSESVTGADYTYANGPHRTTVDYCMMDSCIAHTVLTFAILYPDVLNLSDHLPISINLDIRSAMESTISPTPKLNWQRAEKDSSVRLFSDQIMVFLSSILQQPRPSSPEELDMEITKVCGFIKNAANSHIPSLNPKRKRSYFYRDDTLAQMCRCSKANWRAWRDAGRPRSGLLYDDLKLAKREIKKLLQKHRAKVERKRIQRRDQQVKTAHPDQFRIPRKTTICKKLRVNGSIYTDTSNLLVCWQYHFQALGQSKHTGETEILDSNLLSQASLLNKDDILDDDLTLEEIARAVSSLKKKKSSGADGITAEHLKYGGPSITVWLKRIFNAILALETIPSSLNSGLISPIFKGKGRDPLDPNRYRGITVTSVIAKCLEKAILFRLQPVLEDLEFPHPSQTAYVKGRSCTDGIFSTYEILRVLLQEGDSPFLCLYDIQKAFDSIEYDVLLHHLYNTGINGRTWRLIKSWYIDPTCSVSLHYQKSKEFTIHRGVKQGSVLSPMLFCLVMDKLLRGMSKSSRDLTLAGLSVGCAAHADDIRACCVGEDDVKKQANDINIFMSTNSLALNAAKTEIVHLSRHPLPVEQIDLLGQIVETKREAKSLGTWWCQDLSSTKSAQENIKTKLGGLFLP